MALVYILAERGWSHALSDRCSRSEVFSERFIVYLRGTSQLVGVVERKWRWTDEVALDHFGIRVRDLPFEVSDKIYESLSVGEEVLITFWPRDKAVVSAKKWVNWARLSGSPLWTSLVWSAALQS